MLKMTRETDYAVVLMTHIAQGREGEIHNAKVLAQETRLPLPIASKVLKSLARAGLLESHRGVNGGYSLARAASEISVADIVSALEGQFAINDCSGELSNCMLEDICTTRPSMQRINSAVYDALNGIALSEMK